MTDGVRGSPLPFFTIGHATLSTDEFIALLQGAGVAHLVDVRSIPRSRHNPQFNREALPAALQRQHIEYTYLGSLGGRRNLQREVAPETNGFWENRSFHNYADYALSPAFHAGLQQLLEFGHAERTAVMCAESVWWRCHRRIIADHLLAHGETVCHIMQDRAHPASLTRAAVVHDDLSVTYPPVTPGLWPQPEPRHT